jgi:histidinol-phosphatase
MNADWRSRYELAVETTRRASRIALGYFEQALEVEWKEGQSPVTVADRETEQVLRTTIRQAFPQDSFLGEEFGEVPGSSGFRWIIDPIDGTRSFVRGIPLWATLVGLEYRGEQIAGVVDVPTLTQTYRALRGDGAYRNEQKIHVSAIGNLQEAMVFYSSLSWFIRAGQEHHFLELVHRSQRTRGFGDFYGHVLVAQGSGEVMVEQGVSIWDVAATVALVEEAGGRFTDWSGGHDIARPDMLLTNGLLHDEVLAILQGQGGDRPPISPRAE